MRFANDPGAFKIKLIVHRERDDVYLLIWLEFAMLASGGNNKGQIESLHVKCSHREYCVYNSSYLFKFEKRTSVLFE